MTKIKMLNDRIIFDGHADSRQECETITLICDNLAKSKDFKTVRYESGYAEFEKVGQTNELKFAPPTECSCTMIFDDGVISVACAQDATGSQPSFTWNNSGESNTGYFEGECIFPVTLAPGRILDTVVSSEYNDYVVIDENQFQGMFTTGANFTITITTKAASGLKQVIDVSKLPGWVALATGNHQITIKTKASGYVDSAVSNAVTVSKAAVVSAGKLYFSGDAEMGNTPTATVNGVEVENGYQLSFGDVIVINSKNGDYNGMKINGKHITDLVNDYPPFNIDWTEGGDIVSTQEGFGPSNRNITINYLSPTT